MRAVLLLILLAFGVGNMPALAQWKYSTTSTHITNAPQSGKEFWFAIPELGANDSGSYLGLELIPHDVAEVTIALGDSIVKIWPEAPVRIVLPGSLVLHSSGKAQRSAIHVKTISGSLTCYFSFLAIDRMTGCLVRSEDYLGKEFAVASYASSAKATGVHNTSEFVVIATEDSTHVRITPNGDLAIDGSTTVWPKDSTFELLLQKGEATQFKDGSIAGSDLSGTYISSDKPIVAIGAHPNADLPGHPGTLNALCDMLPPIEKWSAEYLSTPYFRSGTADTSTFLLIGTTPGQIITRTDSIGRPATSYDLREPFKPVFDSFVWMPSLWQSDYPFLLIQYSHVPYWHFGSDIPDGSMVVLTPSEGWSLSYESYLLGGYDPRFTFLAFQCINVIVDSGSIWNWWPRMGKLAGPFDIDGRHLSYRITGADPVTTIVADAPCAVYCYQEGLSGTATIAANPQYPYRSVRDTTAPNVEIIQSSYHLTLHCSDSDSRLGDYDVAELANLRMTLDSVFVPYTRKTFTVTFSMIDSEREASGSFLIADSLGNKTRVHFRNLATTPLVDSLWFDTISINETKSFPILRVRNGSDEYVQITGIGSEGDFLVRSKIWPGIGLDPHTIDTIVLDVTVYDAGYLHATILLETDSAGTFQIHAGALGVAPAGVETSPRSGTDDLHVYPNPSDGETRNIEFDLPSSQSVRVELVSMLGTIVQSEDLGVQTAGRHRFQIPITKLPRGAYELRIVSNAASACRRILVQ